MKTVIPSEFNTEFRFENKSKLTEVCSNSDLVLYSFYMDVEQDGLLKRHHTTNFKNEVLRHIGPTNVLFNEIPCISS